MKRVFVGLFVGTVLACGCCADSLGGASAEKMSDAVIPTSKNYDWWTERHQSVLDRVKQGNVNLIFVGDSITHFWENEAIRPFDKAGKAVWDQYYAPRGSVNMGFSGDRTQHVLWRLQNGEIDGICPKLAVLLIGTNNSHINSSEEIAAGIQAIVHELRTRLPETRVLMLAIFPRGSAEQRVKGNRGPAAFNDVWALNNKASLLASELADNEMIYYLDINHIFLDENGMLSREYMSDLLHPNVKGYERWAEEMEPTIQRLLSE
ncbi:GDSL-type esterase/lipase family protein [Tichowtungia aerotolerans]|uniref:GDSL family lipase n=1 Tax=Tichowtungia aerotolerans TaxID=2697043 RepID=A0A6P1MAC6_9BACT|nr:GDSL-type esterase/lipase family protein [Tichowtungia aerotolerans]QHI69048.1 GDSL family lipase [Tichowtungia aerotolerans]